MSEQQDRSPYTPSTKPTEDITEVSPAGRVPSYKVNLSYKSEIAESDNKGEA